MEVHQCFSVQYTSLENFMKEKYLRDFPDKDASTFEFWFTSDRGRVDGSGRQIRYSYEKRRWMSERLTWNRFWPEEPFPGKLPTSTAEVADFNTVQAYQLLGFGLNCGRVQEKGQRGGPKFYHHQRHRGNMMSPFRGRNDSGGAGEVSARDKQYFHGRAVHLSQVSVGSFVRTQRSLSFEQEGELIGFTDDTSDIQDHSSLITAETPDTKFSRFLEEMKTNTIVCRQCGVTGHPEMRCPYQIVIKQDFDRERHLVCGTFGHKAFQFNSYHGCLECKKQREGITSLQMIECREDGMSEKTELTVVATQSQPKPTGATGVKVTAACGWEEPDYNDAIQEAVHRNTSRSFDEPSKTITTSLIVHELEDNAGIWEIEEFEEARGEENIDSGGNDALLIHF